MRFLVMLISLWTCCTVPALSQQVRCGASQFEHYLPLLAHKSVALMVNQTAVVDEKKTHLVDTLLAQGVAIKKIFCPEHGFRGSADAGAEVANDIDVRSGLPLLSMYGKHKKPNQNDMAGIDIVVYDIQDVGARFYTYISSLQYLMEACADMQVPLLILDRPNPNGFYVDGPVLDTTLRSFVGMQPIPVVYGMTAGEYARMLNGEHWLHSSHTCNLQVIPCTGYTHATRYELPVPPSPNLKSILSVYAYPSLCFFEGTPVSVGRGTDFPFEVFGHPSFQSMTDTFTPHAKPGAMHPPLLQQRCYGKHLQETDLFSIKNRGQLNLSWLLEAYAQNKMLQDSFFTAFFDQLAGNHILKEQIRKGLSEKAIRDSWQPSLLAFKKIRRSYLLYEDFE